MVKVSVLRVISIAAVLAPLALAAPLPDQQDAPEIAGSKSDARGPTTAANPVRAAPSQVAEGNKKDQTPGESNRNENGSPTKSSTTTTRNEKMTELCKERRKAETGVTADPKAMRRFQVFVNECKDPLMAANQPVIACENLGSGVQETVKNDKDLKALVDASIKLCQAQQQTNATTTAEKTGGGSRLLNFCKAQRAAIQKSTTAFDEKRFERFYMKRCANEIKANNETLLECGPQLAELANRTQANNQSSNAVKSILSDVQQACVKAQEKESRRLGFCRTSRSTIQKALPRFDEKEFEAFTKSCAQALKFSNETLLECGTKQTELVTRANSKTSQHSAAVKEALTEVQAACDEQSNQKQDASQVAAAGNGTKTMDNCKAERQAFQVNATNPKETLDKFAKYVSGCKAAVQASNETFILCNKTMLQQFTKLAGNETDKAKNTEDHKQLRTILAEDAKKCQAGAADADALRAREQCTGQRKSFQVDLKDPDATLEKFSAYAKDCIPAIANVESETLIPCEPGMFRQFEQLFRAISDKSRDERRQLQSILVADQQRCINKAGGAGRGQASAGQNQQGKQQPPTAEEKNGAPNNTTRPDAVTKQPNAPELPEKTVKAEDKDKSKPAKTIGVPKNGTDASSKAASKEPTVEQCLVVRKDLNEQIKPGADALVGTLSFEAFSKCAGPLSRSKPEPTSLFDCGKHALVRAVLRQEQSRLIDVVNKDEETFCRRNGSAAPPSTGPRSDRTKSN